MTEPLSHFDDVQSDESIAQVNVYENLDNSDGEDIYGDRLSVPSISTSAQTIRFKFPKSAGASAYLLVNENNVTEATNLLKVPSGRY
ncbi:MAG: hypothetical protein E6H10_15990 [Bacteroidetes bacterium]|nr:MAG: hypothetical protein E6H10_15990 [Bacteroidota bacterium]